MKIKLKTIQKEKLLQALQRENAYKQQFNTVRIQLQEANKSSQDIFEMICDAAGVDPTKYEQQYQVKGDEIILTEIGKTTSDRIKKELNGQGNGQAKAKAKVK